MTTYRFREMIVRGVFRWKDADGKWRQKTQRFSQTINPWNKNALGFQKSSAEIYEELKSERDLWLLTMQNDITAANHL